MKELEGGKNIAGVLINAQSHHPVFDLEYWMSLLPLDSDPICGRCSVQFPENFIENEALREKVRVAGVDLGDPRPVDLFFWSTQPPLKPWLTKFGGVPYRNRSKAWPMKDGVLATFVAQICFRDSLDIFAYDLPGDLLTIFCIRKEVWGHEESDPDYPIIVQWETIDEVESPLSIEDEVHRTFQVPELSGIRHRTYDYDFESLSADYLSQQLIPIASYSWVSVISLPGTKISSTYYPVQPGWDPRDWIRDECEENDSQLVATFYSVELDPILQWAVLDKKQTDANLLGFVMGDPGHLVMFATKAREACSYFIFG